AIRAGSRVRGGQQTPAIVLRARVVLAVQPEARAAGAVPARAAGLRHEAGDHPVKAQAVIEAEPGEIREARHVHRSDVGEEADADRALVGFETRDVGTIRIESDVLRLRNAR